MEEISKTQKVANENFANTQKSKPSIKKIAINSFVLILLIICIILNIVLLASNVFKGNYNGKRNNVRIEFTFYDNTFTQKTYYDSENQSRRYGFYSSLKDKKHYILLQYNGDSNSQTFTRDNVFKLVDESGNKYYCIIAIFLQVLYAIDYIVSLLIIFIYNWSFWLSFTSGKIENANGIRKK